MKNIYGLLLVLLFLSCKKESSHNVSTGENFETSSSGFGSFEDANNSYNGTYCAEVQYYNPNTGTRNTYELDVEVEDGYLVRIDWPNRGWLDETHFSSTDISSGECSFSSDKGYRYTVTLGEKGGGCYDGGARLQNDVNRDTENTTCPRCGGDKDEYDDYCTNCQDEIDNAEEEGY